MFMFLEKRMKILAMCLSLLFCSYKPLHAGQSRILPVLGVGLMAIGSPAMLAGFGGYWGLDYVDSVARPELEQLKVDKANELDQKIKEAFAEVQKLKDRRLGTASVDLGDLSLDDWVNGSEGIEGSGKRIKKVILNGLSNEALNVNHNFILRFFGTPEARALYFAQKEEQAKIDLADVQAIKGLITEQLNAENTFFSTLLKEGDDQLMFERMLHYDRLLIDFNKERISILDGELGEVDNFALSEERERSIYSEFKSNKKKLKLVEKNISDLRIEIESSSEAIFNEIDEANRIRASLDYLKKATLKKVCSFRLSQIEIEIDKLECDYVDLLKRKKNKVESLLALDEEDNIEDLSDLNEHNNAEVEDTRLRDLLDERTSLDKLIKELDSNVSDLFSGARDHIQAYRQHLYGKLAELDQKKNALTIKISPEEISGQYAKVKDEQKQKFELLKKGEYAYLENLIAEILNDESKDFSEKRNELKNKKTLINDENDEIRSFYSAMLLDGPYTEGQKALSDIIEQVCEVTKRSLILETVPKVTQILRESTKDIFSELGDTIGSDDLARSIAIPLEASLKNAIVKNKLPGSSYSISQWAFKTVADGISSESLVDVVSSALRSINTQVSDLELIDEVKEQFIEHAMNEVVDAQMKQFVEETKKFLIFEFLQLSLTDKSIFEELERLSEKGVDVIRESEIPKFEFLESSKNNLYNLGLGGSAAMATGAALLYFSAPN